MAGCRALGDAVGAVIDATWRVFNVACYAVGRLASLAAWIVKEALHCLSRLCGGPRTASTTSTVVVRLDSGNVNQSSLDEVTPLRGNTRPEAMSAPAKITPPLFMGLPPNGRERIDPDEGHV